MSRRSGEKLLPIAFGLIAAMFASVETATADDDEPWRLAWTGAIVTSDSWLTYAGATAAPFGAIDADGLRIRAVTGHGEFDYCETFAFRGRCVFEGKTYRGRATFSDLLIGYQHQFGPLTGKIFAGVARIDNDLDSTSPQSHDRAAGVAWGPKVNLELWMDVGQLTWLSLNASATTAHETYSVTARNGVRLFPNLAIGPEFTLDGNGMNLDVPRLSILARAYARIGLFARYTWDDSEIVLSTGYAGSLYEVEPELYGSVTWAMKF